jgi:hypothetical protein
LNDGERLACRLTLRFEIDDAVVLLLGAAAPHRPSGSISGITRLEKLIFLLEKESDSKEWLDESADFEAYKFGPFSQKIYQSVDLLSAAGLVEDSAKTALSDIDTWEERENIGLSDGSSVVNGGRDPYMTRDFALTSKGWKYFESLKGELRPKYLKQIAMLKERFAFIPLRQLIRYVYQSYPDYTTLSEIRDDIMGNKGY